MPSTILVTGSSGVIGRALVRQLETEGHRALPYDLEPAGGGLGADVLDRSQLDGAIRDCDGVVHLAAVSRVGEAEADPRRTWMTNVGGTENVLEAARRSTSMPWVILASSREVYGEALVLPVYESYPLKPINVYGRSKEEAEAATNAARRHGVNTAVVRLTNVYGDPDDHPQRVVPAFVRSVLRGESLRVDGAGCMLDLVHIDDAVAGLVAMIDRLQDGERELPVVQLVSGHGTTLGELAQMCVRVGGRPVGIVERTPGRGRVRQFVGDPTLARDVLGWQPRIGLEEGLRALAREMIHGSGGGVSEGAVGRRAR